MKKILSGIILFTSSCLSFAQAPTLGAKVEDEFNVTTVPENWKNESAVIIGQRTEYLFTRPSTAKNTATIVRIN